MRPFGDYLKRIKPSVDERIEEFATKKLRDDHLVDLLVRGKRLRAGLLLMVNEAAWNGRSPKALDLACAIELAHSASLIIDDMLDEDELRRGLPTVHMTEGHKRAMLDTVGVLSLPYDIVGPHGDFFVQSLAETQRGMVTGVLKELLQLRPELPASKLYDTIIVQKTARPFGLAASWGYAAGANGSRRSGFARRWREYGIRVGKAMQIADDIADLKAVMLDGRRAGVGSELLLLRCVTAEQLAKELFSDLKKLDLHIEKARDLWSGHGAQKSLARKLANEISAAERCVDEIAVRDRDLARLLRAAPGEIAQMMLDEASPIPDEGRTKLAASMTTA